MIGLTGLISKEGPPVCAPKLNRRRALFVLNKIDQILVWEKKVENERDTRFIELGRHLCEVRASQYWRLDNLKSFDEFLEKCFPESRRKAYYLMAIHEHLPKQARKELKLVGWSKASELVKVARSDARFGPASTGDSTILSLSMSSWRSAFPSPAARPTT